MAVVETDLPIIFKYIYNRYIHTKGNIYHLMEDEDQILASWTLHDHWLEGIVCHDKKTTDHENTLLI